MALNIGELVGYLKLDRTQWSAGITAAKAQLKRLGAGNDDLNELQERVGKTAQGFVTLALRISALAGGLNIIGSLVGALTAMSGGLGLVVAAGFAAVGVMAAVKLGGDGIKAAFEQLNPTLDGVKAKVSATFEKGLAPAVNNLKVLLPQLTGHLQGVAGAVSGVAVQFTAMLRQSATTQQLNGLLDGSAQIVRNLGAALAPIAAAFIRIGAVAMPILVQLTGGAGAVAEKFNAWVQRMADTGNITQWIQTALDAFRSLGAIIGDVAHIVGDVFGALQDAGVGLGGTLGIVVHQIREFLDSAQGHDALVALAQAVGTVGSVVSQVLGAALTAVAPLIPPLATAFSQLATQALPLVTGAIKFLAPILLTIANFIQQNISWIGPLAIGLGIWAAAQWALNAALSANPIGLFILAVTALIAIVATIITYWGPIKDFFAGLWTAVRDFFVSIWNGIWSFLVGVWNSIKDTAAAVWDGIKQFFADWWPFVLGIFTGGIGLIVGLIIQNWDSIVAFTTNIWNSVRDFFVGVWNSIVGFVRSAASNVWSAVSGGVSNAYNAVVDWLGRAVDWVRGVPGRILSALGNLGSLLWNAGMSIIQGFLDGLKAAWNSVTSFIGGIGSWIAAHKGPLSYDRTLLTPHGLAIMAGLQDGLTQGFDPVQDFIAKVGDTISSSLSVTAGTTGIAAAAQEILDQYTRGGNVFEDFSFYGNSQNVRDNNDQIADMFYGSGRANTYDDIVSFLQDLVSQQKATVQIENYHPPADASAADVASDLDWFSRAGG